MLIQIPFFMLKISIFLDFSTFRGYDCVKDQHEKETFHATGGFYVPAHLIGGSDPDSHRIFRHQGIQPFSSERRRLTE